MNDDIFKVINFVLYKRRDEYVSDVSPYLLTRYVSFYDSSYCEFLNTFINSLKNLDADAKTKLLESFFPKMPYKRIQYIKKPKMNDEEPVDKEVRIYNNLNY